ncbi:Cytosine-specific methyltransferase [Georgfuchsia toluolica]|uniref:Cytosine-specific methyltransferase n=1 Tax=Georgfuchsia toluolica TaxID=424218 RepID=A0A916N978_9PROT|nr:DNA (cytosine-5-)-methyltransferase [Georgfuchsia toluolica]CAG4884187.1 Cytosine-specific methyltransferase [Georgfuchsia toluolica]
MAKRTFVEFCAGIGGFRLGLEAAGWECIYSNEVDSECERTYSSNFGTGFSSKDLLTLNAKQVPYADLLCAGFPCQPFSIAGKRLATEDPRSAVLPKLLEIIGETKPRVVLLENVSHFAKLHSGEHMRALVKALSELSYEVHFELLNAKYFGIPQSRERIFIVGIRNKTTPHHFSFTKDTRRRKKLSDVLIAGDNSIPISLKWQRYIDYYLGHITSKDIGFAIPKTRTAIERSDATADLGNCVLQIRSSGIRAISLSSQFPTFAVSHSGGGAMIPVFTGERRHLSLAEMTRLMGFPDSFKFPVSRTNAIKQLSNAVCPEVITSIAHDIERSLLSLGRNSVVKMS